MAERPTILVAEDDAKTRELLEIVLIAGSFDVVTVHDGREALEYLQQHTPDLAILDIDMPFLKGTDVADRMRRVKRLSSVPLIILTASRDDRSQVDAAFSKVDRFMTKPFLSRELLDTVRALLPDRQPVLAGASATGHGLAAQHRRILIVADSEEQRTFIIDVLEEQDHKVYSASSLAAAQGFVHDYLNVLSLVLLDLDLPGGGSLVLLRELRARSALPALLLYAPDQEDLARDYREPRMQKPFSPRALLLAVDRLLARAPG